MAIRANRSGKQTKEWILQTAARLFNEHGTPAVSTKRIAKEMGISPGNLYYHFKNKEEIIRCIMQDQIQGYADTLRNAGLTPLQNFLHSLNTVMSEWNEYPFFKKELVQLLKRDPELRHLYLSNKEKALQTARSIFDSVDQSQVFREPMLPNTFEALLTITSIIMEYWLNYLDIREQFNCKDSLLKGSALILEIWRPYLNESALAEANRHFSGSP